MLKVSHDSEEPVKYTKVNMIWDIVQKTSYPGENLPIEYWKLIIQEKHNNWMELS